MTMLPAASSATGASVTEGGFKTFITNLRAFLYEKLGDDGAVPIQAFAAGTRMLFHQTAAPTGWTKDTSINDKALRVVSGTVGSGGSVAFSTVFGRQATDGHTLTASQSGLPGHSHQSGKLLSSSYGSASGAVSMGDGSGSGWTVDSVVGASASSAHSHNIDLRVQYVDIIVAQKD